MATRYLLRGQGTSRAAFQNFNGCEQESRLSLVCLARELGGTLWHGVTDLSMLVSMLYTATLAWLFLSLDFPGTLNFQLSLTRRLIMKAWHALVIQLASTACR